MSSHWTKPISVHENGEVGRVYYLNFKLIFKNKDEWTRPMPLTLNPDQGSTLEEMITRSREIPQVMKDELLRHRKAEARLMSGTVLKMWFAEEPAPEWWAPTETQIVDKRVKEAGLIIGG